MQLRIMLTHVVLLAAAAATASAATPPQRLAHFDAMPKPALLPDGTLAAYFVEQRGPGLTPTPEVQQLYARYSHDHGRSWSEPQALFTLPSEEGGFGYFVVLVDQDGEVHFFLLCDANTGILRAREATDDRPAVEPLARQRLDVWHVRSTDERTRWTTPRRIWQGRAGDPQSVIQLSNGRIIFPNSYFVNRTWRDRGEGFDAFTFMGQFDTMVLSSDDGGETWQQSPSVLRTPTPHIGAYGAVEPVVIELADGRVWMLLRTQLGRFYESFSPDGIDWSPPRPTSILSSDSPAGLLRLEDGRLLLLWNNNQRYPYAQGARHVLHAAVSADEGRTWRGYREVLRDPHRNDPPPPGGDHGVSYPFPALLGDGRIVYSMWVQSGEGRSLEVIDPAWLEQTTQSDDFSAGLEQWSTYGTRGVEAIAHPESAGRRALSIHRADAQWPAAAVWNFPMGRSGNLRLRMFIEGGFGGATLQLTDHFSVPFDDQDTLFSLFNLPIGPGGDLPGGQEIGGRWIDLELSWDMEQRLCRVLIDNQPAGDLPLLRESPGPSYLRIRCDSHGADDGRLLIEKVEVQITGKPGPENQPE